MVDYSDGTFAAWAMKFQRAVTACAKRSPVIDWAQASTYYVKKTPVREAAKAYCKEHGL